MKRSIAIGVDVGGSHICSAAVDLNTLQIIPQTYYSTKLDNSAPKEVLMQQWSNTIAQSIEAIQNEVEEEINIGFAMPGPFIYHKGIAMFERNEKYEQLYEVSIPEELNQSLQYTHCRYRFINDAMAFGIGVAGLEYAAEGKKVLAITLGTGFGSAFLTNAIPRLCSDNAYEGPFLWDKPYKNGIADEYFSTRWFVKRYQELSGELVKGVKEIADLKNPISQSLFEEFGQNLSDFLTPYLKNFMPDALILGGNISKASHLFLPKFGAQLQQAGISTKVVISESMEEAALVGAARLFAPQLWVQIEKDLPQLI
ncbi:glucokinase [Catalinimonas alkaloidigena]|uniref:ROK family protein n=1 Tax=Catalinimonas alkaloidigena TaxID=1075417 RepID=UPI002406DFB4|nr:ROK family protein [Catalinimonas alkaloidigena]MDF9796480.1 glucokinase [Catalinimonas alkaloidigena]